MPSPKLDGLELEVQEKSAPQKPRLRVEIPGIHRILSSPRFRVALHGSAWTLVGYGASQLFRLTTTMVLARHLLNPKAFGLVALATVALSGLDLLTDLGIGMDVVQHKRGDEPSFLNTAFTIAAGRGVLLAIVAALLAYPFAAFYHQPEITGLTMVAALTIAIRGTASTSVWTMSRHVQLGKLTILTAAGDFIGLAVSIVWAILSPTAWALVAGRVATAAAFSIGSHLVASERISFTWDKTAAKEIMMFGSGIFISSGTYFLSAEAERLAIGKFVSMAELGCFSLALSMAAAPSGALQQVVGKVFFPLLASSLRQHNDLAAAHYKKTRLTFLVVSVILAVGFIAYSHRVVALALPPQYAMTGWMLQLLGFRAALDVFIAPASNLIFACGHSRHAALANTARLALMTAGLWIAFLKFGLHEAVWILALLPTIAYLVLLQGVIQHFRQVLWLEIASFAIFLSISVAAVLVPWPFA